MLPCFPETKECISGKLCDVENSDISATMVTMEIYYDNNQKTCNTDVLDYIWDFKRNESFEYCGHAILGECFDKEFGDDFKVVFHIIGNDTNAICLDFIEHQTQYTGNTTTSYIEFKIKGRSKSHGWSIDGYDKFVQIPDYTNKRYHTLPKNPKTIFNSEQFEDGASVIYSIFNSIYGIGSDFWG